MAPPNWARIPAKDFRADVSNFYANRTSDKQLVDKDLYLIHISAYPCSKEEATELYDDAFVYMCRPAGVGVPGNAMVKRDLTKNHRQNLKWRYISEQTQDYFCPVPMTEAEANVERARIVMELTAFAGRLNLHRLPNGMGKKKLLVLHQGFMLNILMSKAFAYTSVGPTEFRRWARENNEQMPRVLNEDDELETLASESTVQASSSSSSSSSQPPAQQASGAADAVDEIIENFIPASNINA